MNTFSKKAVLVALFALYAPGTAHCMWQAARSRVGQMAARAGAYLRSQAQNAAKSNHRAQPRSAGRNNFNIKPTNLAAVGLVTTAGASYALDKKIEFSKKSLQENILNSWSHGFEEQREQFIQQAIEHITTLDGTELEAITYVIKTYKHVATRKFMPSIKEKFDEIHPSILKEILIYYPEAAQEYLPLLLHDQNPHLEKLLKNIDAHEHTTLGATCDQIMANIIRNRRRFLPKIDTEYEWQFTNDNGEDVSFANLILTHTLAHMAEIPKVVVNMIYDAYHYNDRLRTKLDQAAQKIYPIDAKTIIGIYSTKIDVNTLKGPQCAYSYVRRIGVNKIVKIAIDHIQELSAQDLNAVHEKLLCSWNYEGTLLVQAAKKHYPYNPNSFIELFLNFDGKKIIPEPWFIYTDTGWITLSRAIDCAVAHTKDITLKNLSALWLKSYDDDSKKQLVMSAQNHYGKATLEELTTADRITVHAYNRRDDTNVNILQPALKKPFFLYPGVTIEEIMQSLPNDYQALSAEHFDYIYKYGSVSDGKKVKELAKKRFGKAAN